MDKPPAPSSTARTRQPRFLLLGFAVALAIAGCSSIQEGKVIRKSEEFRSTELTQGPAYWVDVKGETQKGRVVVKRIQLFHDEWAKIKVGNRFNVRAHDPVRAVLHPQKKRKEIKAPKPTPAKKKPAVSERPAPVSKPAPTSSPTPATEAVKTMPAPTPKPSPVATPMPSPTALPKLATTPKPAPTSSPKQSATPSPTVMPKPSQTPSPKPAPIPPEKATPTPKPTVMPKPSPTPVPSATPSNAERKKREAAFVAAEAKASDDPSVRASKAKIHAAASETEQTKAWWDYQHAMYGKMREIAPTLKDMIDQAEAAALQTKP